jgi:hypothetical protein
MPSPDELAPDELPPDELAAEFDILMRRAGITVPADRRPAVLVSYADMREQIALLHNRYAHTDEPANVFRLTPQGTK